MLARYRRLEAEGVWRRDRYREHRDVIVSVGKTTITISTPREAALTHWSLPAMVRVNPGRMPALYCPEGDASETLELAEESFVDAVEEVLESVRRRRGRPRSVRGLAAVALMIAVPAGAALWLPGAVARHTASLLPDVARASIGMSVLSEMGRMTGPPCDAPSGVRALERLRERLFGAEGAQIAVLPDALPGTAHLPGGTILVARTLLRGTEAPDALAARVLAEDVRRVREDPLGRLLHVAGTRAVLVLLTRGRLPEDAVARMAESVVATVPPPVPADALAERVAAAGVAPGTFPDGAGARTAASAGAAPAALPVLGDGDWIALQGICEG